MKKILPLIAVLIAVIIAFAFSVNYKNKKAQKNHADSIITEVKSTEPKKNELIAENKESGYKLFFDGETATLVSADNLELSFSSWKKSIAIAVPELYYNDFDGDGNKELIIKTVDSSTKVTGKTVYSYELYLITQQTVDGAEKLQYSIARESTWKDVFNSAIKFEVTQLKTKKILQFAMNDINEQITYDEETGLTDNKYVSYALALSDTKKHYYTILKYNRGLGVYNILEDGTITLDIQVIVNYNESKENHHIGNIHTEMMINEGKFQVKPKTISFETLDEYKVSDPRETAKEDWSYTINNTSPASSSNSKVIKSIDSSFTVSTSALHSQQSLAGEASDIKNADYIIFSQNGVSITAKEGFSFDKTQLDEGRFSIMVNDGKDDISYSAAVKDDKLFIYFDKTYDRDKLGRVQIIFGK
ncbi:MAG: hypothetical protein K2G65_02250 [Eubacterium sp.]|nr:hypothetical protein [Eubacterium sp.]